MAVCLLCVCFSIFAFHFFLPHGDGPLPRPTASPNPPVMRRREKCSCCSAHIPEENVLQVGFMAPLLVYCLLQRQGLCFHGSSVLDSIWADAEVPVGFSKCNSSQDIKEELMTWWRYGNLDPESRTGNALIYWPIEAHRQPWWSPWPPAGTQLPLHHVKY